MNSAALREAFAIPRDIHYLNCAFMAPLHGSVLAAGTKGILRKRSPWQLGARDFFEESDRLRASFARMIGAAAAEVALVPSVSYGIETAARNLALPPGSRILVLAEQFPSNVYPWMALASKKQLSLLTVARPRDANWSQAVLAALDDSVGLLALPMCHWTDGSMLDLPLIAREAKKRGIPLVLDLTQSLGAVPFDLNEIPCDFLVAAAYKWLLGPYSLAYLYSHPRHHQGEALENNWITREGSEDFSGLVRYRQELLSDGRRFDMGERSNFVLLPMALAALEFLASHGVQTIARELAAKTNYLAAAAEKAGWLAVPPLSRAPHMLGLRHPQGLPADLPARLAEKKVYLSLRGSSVRISPHLYNDQEDLDACLAALLG